MCRVTVGATPACFAVEGRRLVFKVSLLVRPEVIPGVVQQCAAGRALGAGGYCDVDVARSPRLLLPKYTHHWAPLAVGGVETARSRITVAHEVHLASWTEESSTHECGDFMSYHPKHFSTPRIHAAA